MLEYNMLILIHKNDNFSQKNIMLESPQYPEVSPQIIDAILEFRTSFEDPGFCSGEWIEKEGFFFHFSYNPKVLQFIQTLQNTNFFLQINWVDCKDEADRYESDPQALQATDLLTLRRLFTTHVRADRFIEGHLGSIFQNGHIIALLKRLQQIRAEMA